MSDSSVKISARVLMELLAGEISLDRFNELHDWDGKPDGRGRAGFPNPFRSKLSQGRLPQVIMVEPDADCDDDWVEFKFGPPDPAISPFR